MDIIVHAGVTKSGSGTSLVSRTLTSKEGETIVVLLHVRAGEREAAVLEEEGLRIVQHALVDTEGDPWHRLDGTLKEFNGLLKGLLVAESVAEVHAVLAIVETGGTLHVSSAGRGEAYLVRGGTASQITEFSKGKPIPAFVHIASGPLESQDAVVLSTQRLLRTLTPAQLAQVIAQEDPIEEITGTLDAEREPAAVATLQTGGAAERRLAETPPARAAALPSRRSTHKGKSMGIPPWVKNGWKRIASGTGPLLSSMASAIVKRVPKKFSSTTSVVESVRERAADFLSDLKHPERKRRAHFLILAAAVAAFLLIFLIVKLTITSERSKTRAELTQLMEEVSKELKTAENRRLAGDMDGANEILTRADATAKQVVDNESNIFRAEAFDLLDRIRAKREEINNIVRLSPRVLVNLTAKNPDIQAQGIIGVADGEFMAFDRQDWYHVLLNSVDDPKRLTDEGAIIGGAAFPRYKAQVFLTTGNAVIELQGGQPVNMKTEDAAGWVTGKDVETYLRYLYVLSSDNKIEKYERLSNRYGAAVQYNVNGDLTGAVDMAIDSSIYVLKEDGTVVKLMRGEQKPFSIRHAPADTLKNVTKMAKVSDRDFYFLDPAKKRIVVASDGGANGESQYLRQYVLEGDQVGRLQDLYVDPDESHLYVLDAKRIYVIDLVK